ncbi:hypothetical protein ABK040_003397 [Willaertia magna]
MKVAGITRIPAPLVLSCSQQSTVVTSTTTTTPHTPTTTSLTISTNNIGNNNSTCSSSSTTPTLYNRSRNSLKFTNSPLSSSFSSSSPSLINTKSNRLVREENINTNSSNISSGNINNTVVQKENQQKEQQLNIFLLQIIQTIQFSFIYFLFLLSSIYNKLYDLIIYYSNNKKQLNNNQNNSTNNTETTNNNCCSSNNKTLQTLNQNYVKCKNVIVQQIENICKTIPNPTINKKHTLILDLDETLIHASTTPPRRNVEKLYNYILDVMIDQQLCTFYVSERPYLKTFMECVCEWYDVVIFTASVKSYANPVINRLYSSDKIKNRYFRSSCFVTEHGVYVKDLKTVCKDLSKCMIIDNSPVSYLWYQENAVPISNWLADNERDSALLHLLPFLEALRYTDDVRNVLKFRLGI